MQPNFYDHDQYPRCTLVKMSTHTPCPDVDDSVRAIIDGSDGVSGDTVELIVGVREDIDNQRERLDALVERLDGDTTRALGFDIYEIVVPVSRLEELAQAEVLAYIERPDPEGRPHLMGN